MVHTIVIGDGPAGLSAALFLARAEDHTVTVYGANWTGLNCALVHNYLGLPDVLGDDIISREAGREVTDWDSPPPEAAQAPG